MVFRVRRIPRIRNEAMDETRGEQMNARQEVAIGFITVAVVAAFALFGLIVALVLIWK
jgi:hypothetical protein